MKIRLYLLDYQKIKETTPNDEYFIRDLKILATNYSDIKKMRMKYTNPSVQNFINKVIIVIDGHEQFLELWDQHSNDPETLQKLKQNFSITHIAEITGKLCSSPMPLDNPTNS